MLCSVPAVSKDTRGERESRPEESRDDAQESGLNMREKHRSGKMGLTNTAVSKGKKRRLKQTGQEGSEKLNGQREKSKQTNKQKQAEKCPPRNRTTSAEKRTRKEAEAERRRACLGPAWLCI